MDQVLRTILSVKYSIIVGYCHYQLLIKILIKFLILT